MGAEQTNYASRTSEIAQTISSSGLPQNPQEITSHSKNPLNAFGGAETKPRGEGLLVGWLIWMA